MFRTCFYIVVSEPRLQETHAFRPSPASVTTSQILTGHLHDIPERIERTEFEDDVRTILSEFNISDDDIKDCIRVCVRLMRSEKLLRG